REFLFIWQHRAKALRRQLLFYSGCPRCRSHHVASFSKGVDRSTLRVEFNMPLCHYLDRKSTRLNSSHVKNSYAVFCKKKKKRTAEYVFHRLNQHIYITNKIMMNINTL